jgi:hypothetical protein
MDATKVKRGLDRQNYFETAYVGQLDVSESDEVAKQLPSSNEGNVSRAGRVAVSVTLDWELIETILLISFKGEVVR